MAKDLSDIFVLHSTTERSFEKMIETGGLIAPSYAITKEHEGYLEYASYGDVFLLMKPEVLSNADIYNGDGNTPTCPNIYKKLDEPAASDYISEVLGVDYKDVLGKAPYEKDEPFTKLYYAVKEKMPNEDEEYILWLADNIYETCFFQEDYVPTILEEDIGIYVMNNCPFDDYMTPASIDAIIDYQIQEHDRYPNPNENLIDSFEEFRDAVSNLGIEHDYLEAKSYEVVPFDKVSCIFIPEDAEIYNLADLKDVNIVFYETGEDIYDYMQKLSQIIHQFIHNSALDINNMEFQFDLPSLDDSIEEAQEYADELEYTEEELEDFER